MAISTENGLILLVLEVLVVLLQIVLVGIVGTIVCCYRYICGIEANPNFFI